MQVEVTSSLVKRPPVWQTVMNWALPLILVAVFTWQIHKSWHYIRTYHWNLQWGFVALAFVLLLLNSFLEILIWNKTLGWFTRPLPFNKATPVYIWSSLARYIPGKIASLILRVALAAETQREVIPVLASSTVELALRIASGLVLLLLALFASGATGNTTMLTASLIIIPVVLILAHPKIMLPVMNWALKKIKKPPISQPLRYRDVLGVFGAILLRWAIYGTAFVCLACALFPEAVRHAAILICTAGGSWSVGFILLSPGGVGLAEMVQKQVMQSMQFPGAIALILPILFRVASLLAEGLWALASIPMRNAWQSEATAPETEQVG